MKTLAFLLSLLPLLLLHSCRPYYGLANTGSQGRYLAKPVYQDANKSAVYIGGQVYKSNGYGYEFEDKESEEDVVYGDVAVHKSHTWSNYNLSYGAFGYAGTYEVREAEEYTGKKSFAGGGILGEANFNIPFDYVDWRILGLRVAGKFEGGEYSDFRTTASNEEDIYNIHPHDATVNFSLTSSVDVKLENVNFGFYSMAGYTTGFSDHFTLGLTFGAQCTFDRFTVYGQLNSRLFDPAYFFLYGKPQVGSLGLSYRL